MIHRLPYSLEQEEYVAALQAVTGGIMAADMHQRWLRLIRSYTFLYYTFMAMAAVSVAFWFPQAATGVLVFALLVVAANHVHRHVIDRSEIAPLGATFDSRSHRDVVATFGPERASLAGRGHEQSWDWTLLQRFHELPDVFVLEFAGFDMLAVPRRAFASADEARRWAADIRGRLVEEAAVKRTD
jgi:hypothetical protein